MSETVEESRARRTREKKQNRLRNYQRSRGAVYEFDLVPADESIRILRRVKRERNGSAKEMARVAGIPSSTALRLLKLEAPSNYCIWPPGKVSRRTAELIAKLEEDDDRRGFLPGSLVDRKKPRQVVRSLFAQGFTADHLAFILKNNTGVSGNCVLEVTKRQRQYTTWQSFDRVMWLEKNIGDKVGPSTQLRRKMLTLGVYPTKHYDAEGDLITSTLPPKVRAFYDSV